MEQQRQQQQGMVEVVMEMPQTTFAPQQQVYCMPYQQFQFQPVMQHNVNNMWRPVGFEQPAQKMAPAPAPAQVVYYQVAQPVAQQQQQQPLDYGFENSDELVGLLCFDDEVPPATQTDDAKSVASASTCDASVVETAELGERPNIKVECTTNSCSSKKRKHDVLESENATYRKMIAASLSGSKRSVQFCSVCFNVRRRDGELVYGHRSDGFCPVKQHRATAEEKRELRRIRQKVRRSINRKLRDQNQQQQQQKLQLQQQQQQPTAQPSFVYNGWNQCSEVQVL